MTHDNQQVAIALGGKVKVYSATSGKLIKTITENENQVYINKYKKDKKLKIIIIIVIYLLLGCRLLA
jgi:hypothetical protein